MKFRDDPPEIARPTRIDERGPLAEDEKDVGDRQANPNNPLRHRKIPSFFWSGEFAAASFAIMIEQRRGRSGFDRVCRDFVRRVVVDLPAT